MAIQYDEISPRMQEYLSKTLLEQGLESVVINNLGHRFHYPDELEVPESERLLAEMKDIWANYPSDNWKSDWRRYNASVEVNKLWTGKLMEDD